jgi:hypothetical protein
MKTRMAERTRLSVIAAHLGRMTREGHDEPHGSEGLVGAPGAERPQSRPAGPGGPRVSSTIHRAALLGPPLGMGKRFGDPQTQQALVAHAMRTYEQVTRELQHAKASR